MGEGGGPAGGPGRTDRLWPPVRPPVRRSRNHRVRWQGGYGLLRGSGGPGAPSPAWLEVVAQREAEALARRERPVLGVAGPGRRSPWASVPPDLRGLAPAEPTPAPKTRECPRCVKTYLLRLFPKDSDVCRWCRSAVKVQCEGRMGHRQRARGERLAGDLTDEQWAAILRAHEYRCAYCGGPWQVMDHRVPVVLGGQHTASNVVPACLTCNSRKGGAIWAVSFHAAPLSEEESST